MQQVLDETPYQQQQYHQEQNGSPNGYAEYYNYAATQDGEHQVSGYQQHSEWPTTNSSSSADTAAAGYGGFYYAQEAALSTVEEEQQHEQYGTPGRAQYYDYTTEGFKYTEASHTAELYPPPSYYDPATAAATPDQTTVDSYYHYRAEHEAMACQIESDIVEAHAVVVEDATTYEEILAPMPQQWSCRQCTFLNPISGSFCEMCQDHISASPDMAGVNFHNGAQAPAYGGAQALVLSAQSTPPVSPLYSPSAPSYEVMDCDDGDQHPLELLPPAPIAILSPPVPVGTTPTIPSEVAKQLAFQGDGASMGADCEVIHPTKVRCQPPAPAEHYLALAFKGKAGTLPLSLAHNGGNAVVKSDQVRREDALTEYSF